MEEKRIITPGFVLPVVLENLVVMVTGLLFSRSIAAISDSALAATGIANVILTTVFAVFSVVITGGAVIVSRLNGEGDRAGAEDTVERTLGFAAYLSIAVTALLIAVSAPMLRILEPSAEPQFLRESLRYYRVLMLSLPLYVLYSVMAAMCQAMGDTRRPMIAIVTMNVVQLGLAWVFIRSWHMEELGAALTYVCCRGVGLALMTVALLHNRPGLRFRFGRMVNLAGGGAVIRRVLRVGTPVSVSGTFVQIGYLLINSMAISLGTFSSGVYQILTSMNGHLSTTWTVCRTVALPAVGNLLGARRIDDARRTGRRILWASILVAAVPELLCLWKAEYVCGLLSMNPDMVAESARLFWVMLPIGITSAVINALEPQLQAGGDVKTVMTVTLIAVWAVRIPLTWLFVYVLHWGVTGLFLANLANLCVRAGSFLVRHCGTKWYKKHV